MFPCHCTFQGVASASFALAVSVLKNCDGKLERYLCQFLTSCILNRDAAGSVVKEFYHEIIFQMFQIAPQMLLSVIPNLTHELLVSNPFRVHVYHKSLFGNENSWFVHIIIFF